MKLGEFETTENGGVRHRGRFEYLFGNRTPPAEMSACTAFVKELHAAHERGDVVAVARADRRAIEDRNEGHEYLDRLGAPGSKGTVSIRERLAAYLGRVDAHDEPLTAAAIGDAVAKALVSNAIATYSDQMMGEFGRRAADAIGIAVAKALATRPQEFVVQSIAGKPGELAQAIGEEIGRRFEEAVTRGFAAVAKTLDERDARKCAPLTAAGLDEAAKALDERESGIRRASAVTHTSGRAQTIVDSYELDALRDVASEARDKPDAAMRDALARLDSARSKA